MGTWALTTPKTMTRNRGASELMSAHVRLPGMRVQSQRQGVAARNLMRWMTMMTSEAEVLHILPPTTYKVGHRRGAGRGTARYLGPLNDDDDQRDGGAEHAAEHGGRGAHGVDARLDVPRGQQLHQQQAARRAERPAHLRRTDLPRSG